MAFQPEKITREHILKAIDDIDHEIDKLKITSGIATCVEDLAEQAGQYGRGVSKVS